VLTSALDTFRLSLHVLAVTVWVGGQITLLGLLPAVRAAGPEVPGAVARRFNRVAWPAFGVAVVTGVWNLFEVDTGAETSYDVVLLLKLVAVAVSGIGAWLHTQATTPAGRGIWGGVGLLASVAALVLGVALQG
jgi:putative copper export protein